MQRSRAAPFAEIKGFDGELAGLVCEIVLDAGAGEDDDTDGQDVEDLIVALEGGGFGVARPVGFEGDLHDLAGLDPFGGDQFGTARRSAVEQHHVGVLGVNLVERVPDQPVIVEIHPAGEGDLGSRWQIDLGIGAGLRCEEVPAVDHGCGEIAVIDP